MVAPHLTGFCVLARELIMLHSAHSLLLLRRLSLSLLSLVASFALMTSVDAQPQLRTWTSSTGKQVEATFKEIRDGAVYLTDQQGKEGKFSPSQFSEPDQKYIRELNLYNKAKERWDKDPKKDSVKKPEPVQPKDPRGTTAVPSQPGQPTPPPAPSTDDPMTTPLMAFVKRNWKDVKGRSIDGRLFNAKGDKVYIQNSDPEKVVAVPIKNLEKKDQEYVTIQLKGLGRTDLLLGLGLIEADSALVAKQDPAAPNAAGTPMNPGAAPAMPITNFEMPANVIPPNISVNSVLQSVLDNMKKRK
jgi:hypothetical protein